MAASEIKRYQIPTHLKVEDRLSIGFFSFTLRQIAVLMLGGGAAFDLWQRFPVATLALVLGETPATWLRVGLVLPIILATLALALVKRHGHTLETWFLLWLRFRLRPCCYRWQQMPDPLFSTESHSKRTPTDTPEEDQR